MPEWTREIVSVSIFKKKSPTQIFEQLLHFTYLAYVVVTIGSLWFFGLEKETARSIILTIAVSLLVVFLLAYQLLITYKFGLKSRYAEAQSPMHQCQHCLRDTYRYLSRCLSDDYEHNEIKFEDTKFREMLKSALTSLNTAFCIATAVNCRTSIKLLGVIDDKLDNTDNYYLRTLARDEVSSEKRKYDDENEMHKHRLNANSDFQSLFNDNLDFYSNGTLWKDTSYRNSSDSQPQTGNKKRKDYNSTIVWPIRYKLQPNEQQNNGEQLSQILLGFLTVDALPANAFENRFDVDLGAQVADTLYIVLQRYREVKKANSGT